MYLFFGLLFLILPSFFYINHWRRKQIIKRIRCMCTKEKCCLLDDFISPFGYAYLPTQDIFASRLDVQQRDFDYCTLYGKATLRHNTFFDYLPIYFNFEGKTWLLELWKGQYGINTGAEIGVYCAERTLSEQEYRNTLFQSVKDCDMPALSFRLFRKGSQIADVCAKHWYLAAFSMGRLSAPADLYMQACFTFASHSMAHAFVDGLINTGYPENDIHLTCSTVAFSFAKSTLHWNNFDSFQARLAQCANQFWYKVYLFVTRPFCLSIDRTLYLYYYFPAAFHKTLRIQKCKKRAEKATQ